MIALFFIVILIALLLQWYSMSRGMDSLEVSMEFADNMAEPGEQFELLVTLTNHKRTFLPFLEIQISLPEGLVVDADEKQQHFDRRGKQYVTFTAWLLPRQSMTRHFTGTASKRGRYLVQSYSVSNGDFLGISKREITETMFLEMIVLPKEASDQDVEQALGGFLGDISVNRFIYEDPVLTVGYRDYTGREPFKMISWTQTARTGQLMVREYDHTAEASVSVVLNIASDGKDPDKIEQCFSLARTVCRMLEEMRISYSFYTNAFTSGDFDSFRIISKGLGDRHFMHILEGLGRAIYEEAESCEKLLERAVSSSDETRSLLFITPEKDEKILSTARFWANKAGGRLCVMTGEEEAAMELSKDEEDAMERAKEGEAAGERSGEGLL